MNAHVQFIPGQLEAFTRVKRREQIGSGSSSTNEDREEVRAIITIYIKCKLTCLCSRFYMVIVTCNGAFILFYECLKHILFNFKNFLHKLC